MAQAYRTHASLCTLLCASLLAAACGGSGSGAPEARTQSATAAESIAAAAPPAAEMRSALDAQLRALVDAHGLTGDAAFNRTLPQITDPLAQLGMQLFFSKSLSGDFDTACVSCHHPSLGGADGLSLPVGVKAVAPDLLGPGRRHASGLPPVPRNSPTVFNAGLWDTGMFWDSRVESFGREAFANGAVSDIRTPDVRPGQADPHAGANLPAAQARFPVTSNAEMRGDRFEAGSGNAAVRQHLAARLGDYGMGAGEIASSRWRQAFETVFGPAESAGQLVTFDRIAQALAAYQRSMVFTTNAFSDYVSGNDAALTDAQKRGAVLFFTDASAGGGGCAGCHSGDAFTDGEHHLVAFPQFGPGKGDGNADDFGRERETRDISDRYRFRTPSLLNVAVTAPYGHAGTYETLDQVMAHYDDPHGTAAAFFDGGGACVLEQFRALRDCGVLYPRARANTRAALARMDDARAAVAARFADTRLDPRQRDDLVAFMHALTDPCVLDRSCLAPWIADPGESPDEHHLRAVDRNGETL